MRGLTIEIKQAHMMQSSGYNICFVYEYGDESWSTPYSVMKEFSRLGWKVNRVHLSKSPEDLLKGNYDIILIMDWKGIDIPDHVHDSIPESTYKIRENGDEPQNYHNHTKHCHKYNLLLTPDYQSHLLRESSGYNSLWWTHFADTDIHTEYLGFDRLPPARSTRGPGGSQLLDTLSRVMPDKFINRNGLVGSEYGCFLNNGDITVQNSRWHEITRRVFEGMACNTMVLTDRLPVDTKIQDLFEEDVDIVYYDSVAECISKINYYLSPQGSKDRIKIARNGYNKVLENHTQKQRVQQIINKWKEHSQS